MCLLLHDLSPDRQSSYGNCRTQHGTDEEQPRDPVADPGIPKRESETARTALRAALCLHPTTGCMSSTRTPCAGWLGQVVSKSARAPMPTTEGTGGRRDRSKRSGSFNGDSGRAVRVSKLMVIDLGTSEPVCALRPTLPCPCGWSGGRTCWLCRSRASRARSRWYSSRKSYTNYRASS